MAANVPDVPDGIVLPIIRIYSNVMAVLDEAERHGNVPALVQYGPDPCQTLDITDLSNRRVPRDAIAQVVESVDIVSNEKLRLRASPCGGSGLNEYDMMPVRGCWIACESGCVAFGANGTTESGVIVPYWPGGILEKRPEINR